MVSNDTLWMRRAPCRRIATWIKQQVAVTAPPGVDPLRIALEFTGDQAEGCSCDMPAGHNTIWPWLLLLLLWRNRRRSQGQP